MILYNMRYRGPFEYDKFVLNTFQIANEAKSLLKKINKNDLNSLNNISKQLDNIYQKLTSDDSTSMNILLNEHRTK